MQNGKWSGLRCIEELLVRYKNGQVFNIPPDILEYQQAQERLDFWASSGLETRLLKLKEAEEDETAKGVISKYLEANVKEGECIAEK